MKKIINKIPKIIIPFLYLQPILDIIAAFFIKNNITTNITAIIRMIFMGLMIIYLLLAHYENKKKYITFTGLSILTILIHMIIMYNIKGTNLLFFEFKNTLSSYYFIFITLAFMIIYKDKELNKKHFRNILFIYLFFTFVPTILGLSFESYDFSKTGKLGWFYSANAVGSIIVILLSLTLTELKKLKLITKTILAIIILYVSVTIGTKTPVLGLAIIIGLNLIYIIANLIKEKKKIILLGLTSTLIVILISACIIIPKTNFYKNIQTHLNYLEEKNYKIPSLKFIDHFVFSKRFTKEEKIRKYYNNSSTLEKVFGIGYMEKNKKDNYVYNIAEIDYFDMFYKEGIIGFILFISLLIYLIINYLKNIKFNFEGINKLACLIIILLLAFFQGHILLTPAISIFIGIILTTSIKRKEVKNEFNS